MSTSVTVKKEIETMKLNLKEAKKKYRALKKIERIKN